jgi:UDP-N-acetylmuramoyl-L-alanyl-D-glutamate--2,6-diaminopimelate ligase
LQLADLLQGLDVTAPPGAEAIEIIGITADSRAVRPGFLFAAIPGSKLDGRRFIADAAAAGAVAVLAPTGTDAALPVIGAAEPRRALALVAARFHGRQPATVVAVTGTNGKTSVASFVRQIWTALGLPAASIGTLGLEVPGRPARPSLTTPDPVALQADLAALAADGIEHLAMEASSHGLDQFRLDGVRLAAAGFTNLSRDHLDYHGSMAAYLEAKSALFQRLLPAGAAAVLNADVPEFATLAAIARGRAQRVIDYGTAASALRLVERRPTATGQDLALQAFGREVSLHLPLVGAFQAANVLCALGLAVGSGSDVFPALATLPRLTGVAGRLQHVATTPDGAAVYVDYAHTPDALETVLTALRPHAEGRLVVVFGAGGDRDTGKRPVMGAVTARLADIAIVTDDNPRSEVPAAIRAAVLAGCPGGIEIGDRAEAIREAVRLMRRGDLLVVAGKGHEQGQTIGTTVRPFDDATVVREAVEDLAGCGV